MQLDRHGLQRLRAVQLVRRLVRPHHSVLVLEDQLAIMHALLSGKSLRTSNTFGTTIDRTSACRPYVSAGRVPNV